jgi:DAACS family dicarboxylate/amino acid:cation (Na+ or H+) symporter
MFFAIMMGAAMLGVGKEKAAPLKAFLESIYEVMLKIIGYGMALAPFGVAGLMFSMAQTIGVEAILSLTKYVAVVLGALLFQQCVVYMGMVKVITGRNPITFILSQREALLTAFSTSSSVATLPTAMRTATDQLKLPKRVSDFVLTVGSTLNHHGTALFEGITILFLAQLFGVHLTIAQQIPVILMAILGGFGTAGVPGGSLPMIVVVLNSIGVPGESIAIILGIDRILDMSRTTLNVAGDLTIATLVAHGEPHEESLESVVPGEEKAAEVAA